MNKLKDYGKVWMASSPLTQNFGPIKRAVDLGVDGVILKSITPGVKEPRVGKRILKVNQIMDPLQRFPLHYPGSVYSTSTHWDVECMSIEEANHLYDKIKSYDSKVKVIQSFSPSKIEDFDRIADIKSDGLELNSCAYDLGTARPYVYGVLGDRASEAENDKERMNVFYSNKARRSEIFRKKLEALGLGVPIIFKASRGSIADDDFFEWNIDGFTFSDSQKSATFQRMDNYSRQVGGKVSLSGELLWEGTIGLLPHLRKKVGDKYLFASGGIMNSERAKQCIENGADAVQICSAVYVSGWKALERIVNEVKRRIY